jgi:2,3-bisphosphoglycerate-independent phosphoglycerate mutase
MPNNHPVVLLILDGWGYSIDSTHNAITQAYTPQWDRWWNEQVHTLLEASGKEVGLPDQQMGNSEVGHMHIGAGRVIPQDFTRINESIASGTFFKNPVFTNCAQDLKNSGKALHIMGLLSPGGVHSHEKHLFALLNLFTSFSITPIYLHLFLDGRDTPPKSALQSLNQLQEHIKDYPSVHIASITGRYYAMDRDQRWSRIEPVYQMLTEGTSLQQFATTEEALEYFYEQRVTDEFIPPTLIGPALPVVDGDAIVFFNFRADRARQLTQVFLEEHFIPFARQKRPKISQFVSLTLYSQQLATTPAFPPIVLNNTLGQLLSEHHLRQLRIAETEKYAHVTFFFNGGLEEKYPLEERILIPSPAVATYDESPEMSAAKITETIVEAIEKNQYDIIICNFANADMVGHTGNFTATMQAIEALDRAFSAIGAAIKKQNGYLLITSDHGNAEAMFDDQTHQAHTAHTNNPVPFLFVGEGYELNQSKGQLTDIAPTILLLLGISQPLEMTGHSLLKKIR